MPLFTPLNAAEMAHRSQASRRERKVSRMGTAYPGQIAGNEPGAADNLSPARETPADNYTADQLTLVRDQITQMHVVLREASKVKNAKDAKAAADALSRLYDVERVLAGRPLPGTRKPLPNRSPRVIVEPWKDAS